MCSVGVQRHDGRWVYPMVLRLPDATPAVATHILASADAAMHPQFHVEDGAVVLSDAEAAATSAVIDAPLSRVPPVTDPELVASFASSLKPPVATGTMRVQLDCSCRVTVPCTANRAPLIPIVLRAQLLSHLAIHLAPRPAPRPMSQPAPRPAPRPAPMSMPRLLTTPAPMPMPYRKAQSAPSPAPYTTPAPLPPHPPAVLPLV